MVSWTDKDTSNILVLENSAITRNCPSSALQPSEFARFLILSAPLRGKELVLKPLRGRSRWILGAGKGADFSLADPTLQANHLFIERLGVEWLVTSHKDCWGFYVNNEPVETAVIEHGDRLRVGRHEMVFVDARPSVELDEEEIEVKEHSRGWLRWFNRAS